ncbi:MAG: histidine--tRNA ligase [Paludibacteraceae bacterium]|nr:histidine--tRNA ligase [Paludibacteraceae bacterium]MEE0952121.1 histidine--tRNA ligase [Paludibacteraceae bacterium]
MQKPSIPKGTRDFSPLEMARRNYIFNTIQSVFSLYGFQQIETPAMENIGTLMGKYGEEGDKLLFRIQNSGEKAASAPEKGLRYDLTVPFARYVVQHRENIQFPFKRYQIQPVWRADRPQKGRYREFYQCDVDVIGTNSLVCELELIQIVEEVYRRLGINVCLHINNRKVLAGIAEIIGQPEKIIDITVAIDKLDKIGIDNVNKELTEKGLPQEAIEALQPILHLSGSTADKIAALRGILASSKIGTQGVEELEQLFALIQGAEVKLNIELDLCLARGLNYYTGAIFEVKALDVQMGSITGGGRYDNLTGIFGMPNVSGVGISFGADRIYDVLTELNLYPASLQSSTQLLFATFGQEELTYALSWAKALREQKIAVEVYPEPTKMKKQMGYADTKQIPFVAIVGGDEMAQNKVMLKNMLSGEQKLVTIDELLAEVK